MYEDWGSPGPQPLVFVDGVLTRFPPDPPLPGHECEGDPPLRAEDIENIDIVRGPEAVRRFGPEAVHGVILVTTRRAPAGSRP